MFAEASVGYIHYGVFTLGMVIILALDLGVFNREAHRISFKEALCWSSLWFSCSVVFAIFAIPEFYSSDIASQKRIEYLTGYVLELSLSMDNVFVIALIFSYFKVHPEFQHRVLFWGILGALIMRGLMIGIGAAAVAKWEVILYLFGAFLLFTGVKMIFSNEDEGVEPENNVLVRIARKLLPVHKDFVGDKFIIQSEGRRMLTPMAIVLITIESTDVIFAVDSIPAIFVVTTDPFIVFTSNMFAILGLRSLYFVLAGAIDYFHYLKYGLSLVLVFIGAKMLCRHWVEEQFGEIPHWSSLAVVGTILLASIIASVFYKKNSE